MYCTRCIQEQQEGINSEFRYRENEWNKEDESQIYYNYTVLKWIWREKVLLRRTELKTSGNKWKTLIQNAK